MKLIRIFLVFLTVLPLLAAGAGAKKPRAFSGTADVKIKIEGNFLLLPMKGNEDYNKISLADEDGNVLFKVSALLTDETPQWFAPINVSQFKGKELSLTYQKLGYEPSFRQVDEIGFRDHSRDRGRPTFHLTSKDGYMGDICGLVCSGGKWHAFFLYNPFAMNGQPPYSVAHAVSEDLINWTYEPNFMSYEVVDGGGTVYPTGGDAFFDKGNKSGLFDTENGAFLVLEKSDGSTWLAPLSGGVNVKLSGVGGRSLGGPSVFYDGASKQWVLVKCVENGKVKRVDFYVSPNLSDWKYASGFEADFPSPTICKMSASGNDEDSKYVLWSGDGRYFVGNFDGSKFSTDFAEPQRVLFGDVKSARFWRNAPDNRNIVAARVDQPGDLMRTVGQAFSQSMGTPWDVRLADTKQGYRMRVSLPTEIVAHMGQGSDGLGLPSMAFRSNVFMLPDAVGNNFIVVLTFDTRLLDGFSIRAGVAKFGYSKGGKYFETTRIEDVKHIQPFPDGLPDAPTSAMVVLDNYSAELFFQDGSAVVMMGDSYLNPEQKIKVGCNGEMVIYRVTKIPVLPTTEAQRAAAARELMKAAETPKKAE